MPSSDAATQVYEIRDRHIGGVLDQAIFLFRDHIKPIAIVILLFYVPLTGLAHFVSQLMTPDPMALSPDEGLPGAVATEVLASLWLILAAGSAGSLFLFVLATSYGDAVIMHAIAQRYIGRPVPLRASMRVGLRLLPRMFVLQFSATLVVLSGICMCIVPGLILGALFYVADAVLVLERTSVVGAFARSVHLLHRSIGPVVALLLMVIVIGEALVGLAELLPEGPAYYALYLVGDSVGTALDILVTLVLYFAARCRVEHLDLDLLADRVDVPPPREASAL